jgi:LmbE family N-acetylglucosaminyl deacetylase
MSDVLVISPHPDDEVIGCGGAILNHVRAGRTATVITLGMRLQSEAERDITESEYRSEGEAAHRILGVTRHVSLDLPGRPIEVTRDLLMSLVREYRAESPGILYLPHANEGDWDHRQTHRAAIEALWMAESTYFTECGPPMRPPGLVLAYEVWAPLSEFQYVEPIDDVLESKVSAMECYRSQLRSSEWNEAIRGLAKYRGVITSGRGAAEVFQVLRLAQVPAE